MQHKEKHSGGAAPPELGQKSYFCVAMKKKKHLTRKQRYTIFVKFYL